MSIEIRTDLARSLLRYWEQKRGDRPMPARKDIDPTELVSLLPRLKLVDVEHNPRRYRFRLVGTELVTVYGRDYTNMYLDQLDVDAHFREINRDYDTAVESMGPVCNIFDYVMDRGKHRRFERLLLPLSDNQTTVTMLLGGQYDFVG
ncbi:MAG: PAS domain-containing protein [Inquilinaceae bacterium]